jgi:hypothetical protein
MSHSPVFSPFARFFSSSTPAAPLPHSSSSSSAISSPTPVASPPKLLPPPLLRNKLFIFTLAFLSSTALLAYRFGEECDKNYLEVSALKERLAAEQHKTREKEKLAESKKNYRQQLIWLLEKDSNENGVKKESLSTGPYKRSWTQMIGMGWGTKQQNQNKEDNKDKSNDNSIVPLDLLSPALIASVSSLDREWRIRLAGDLRALDQISTTEKIEEILVKKHEEKKIQEEQGTNQDFRL